MSEPPPTNVKIKDENIRALYDKWWSKIYDRDDPIKRTNLVTEAFIGGWSAGKAYYMEQFHKLLDALKEEKSKHV